MCVCACVCQFSLDIAYFKLREGYVVLVQFDQALVQGSILPWPDQFSAKRNKKFSNENYPVPSAASDSLRQSKSVNL